MKQIIQDLKKGDTILEEVPAPVVKPGHILIRTTRSLVSLGTEKMLVEFGKASLVEKARQQPDKVKMVLDKIKADGLFPTLEAVFSKLNQPLPLGYCNVGVVEQVGSGVEEFNIGDRVASNGHHAEFVCVPKNLAAKIPDNVSDDEAAFTVIGSIGLQGIRLINPTFGESIVVVGLGLIGLITAELLKANGCQVIGFDFDEKKVQLARSKGIDAVRVGGIDPVNYVMQQTGQIGADGVVITASTKSDEVIAQAAHMSRKRGRIVLVGVVGLDLSRSDFYEKELTFQVSCSYGPGRYDYNYEQKGNDYPIGFVRWTEKRNFEAILAAIGGGSIDVKPLISETHPLHDFHHIYGRISNSDAIASLLSYPIGTAYTRTVEITPPTLSAGASASGIGIIGAGNFANAVILPSLKRAKADLKYLASASGLSSATLAKKFGVAKATSDYQEMLSDPSVGMVIVTTRHNLHASMAVAALESEKNVFVEKPLAINEHELQQIVEAQKKSGKSVLVGYNRRFSPHSQKVKRLVGNSPVLNITATMNAGFLPANLWVQDIEVGGGRIIGEACHFIDLLIYFTGSNVAAVCMNALGPNARENTDNASILLKFHNGSNGVINYFANGSKAYAKERIEIFHQQTTLVIDNFRKTTGYGVRGFRSLKSRQDKGHKSQFELLANSLRHGGDPLIPFDQIVNSTKAAFACIQSLKTKGWVEVE